MARPPVPDRAAEPNASAEEDFYEVPAELDGLEDGPTDTEEADPELSGDASAPGRSPLSRRLAIGIGVAVVILAATGVLVYRARQRALLLHQGLARAEELLRDDTAASYRQAAELLEPLTQLDPLEAGSARAFALAMLAADYRDARAEELANALLVEPGRAQEMPRHAALATAALSLGRMALGDATSAANDARNDEGGPDAIPDPRWSQALKARIGLRAGQLDSAVEPAELAAAARPGQAAFPPGLAIQGDVLRRNGDAAGAAEAYRAALQASEAWRPAGKRPPGRQPRSVYGLAKAALSGAASAEEATRHLVALSHDDGTPAPERSRAAIYLAALQLRAGARDNAAAALDAAGLQGEPRVWAERAAAALAANRGPYRAVLGAPLSLQSASDDDPGVLKPLAPEPPPPPPAVEPAPAPAPKAAAKPATKKTAPVKKATAKASTAKSASAKATSAKKTPASTKAAKKTTSKTGARR